MGKVAIILGQNSLFFIACTPLSISVGFSIGHVAVLQIQPSRRGSLEKTLRGCHGAYPVPRVKHHPGSQSREPTHGTVPRKEGIVIFIIPHV